MKILIAGATGAIGQPLMQILEQHSHQIYGITQSKEHFPLIQNKGGKPVILDVLDREAVLSALEAIQPDIVIDMLTRLPKSTRPKQCVMLLLWMPAYALREEQIYRKQQKKWCQALHSSV